MKSKSGFTLIEILVVIVVISILASIATLSFSILQRESRDSKRANDILVLSEEFERYYTEQGGYPFSCNLASQRTENNPILSVMYCMSDRYNSIYSGHTAPLEIWRGTALGTLRNTFTNISESFGDPRAPTGQNPINAASSNFGTIPSTTYFVFSPDLAPNSSMHHAGTISFATSSGGQISCEYNLTPNIKGHPNTRPHQYVMGYYSEVKDAWQFYKSTSRSDINPTQWSSSSSPDACATSDISTLKSS